MKIRDHSTSSERPVSLAAGVGSSLGPGNKMAGACDGVLQSVECVIIVFVSESSTMGVSTREFSSGSHLLRR